MDSIPPMNYPREGGSPVYGLPLQPEGPAPFFPPMCLKSHWDPTAILRKTLPDTYMAMPLDPRPWTRICLEYTTAGGQEAAPPVQKDAVLPSGGQFYPPDRYSAAIDAESALRRLDRPLGTCEGNQYFPNKAGDMYNSRILVPERAPPSNPAQIQEIAYPQVLLRNGPYPCRQEADDVNMRLSSEFMFNNATKQDRYRLMKKDARPKIATGAIVGSKMPNIRSDMYIAEVPTEFPAVAPVSTSLYPVSALSAPAPATAATATGPATGPATGSATGPSPNDN